MHIVLKLQSSLLSLQIPLFLADFHKFSIFEDKKQLLLGSFCHIYCVIYQKLRLLNAILTWMTTQYFSVKKIKALVFLVSTMNIEVS